MARLLTSIVSSFNRPAIGLLGSQLQCMASLGETRFTLRDLRSCLTSPTTSSPHRKAASFPSMGSHRNSGRRPIPPLNADPPLSEWPDFQPSGVLYWGPISGRDFYPRSISSSSRMSLSFFLSPAMNARAFSCRWRRVEPSPAISWMACSWASSPIWV